jgi:site-specific DNA-methyltransferase (adenine-specific)
MNAHVFNKSSREMKEVPDNSVDLVYTSPPYNIGTVYNSFLDATPLEEYEQLLREVFSECVKKINNHGILVLEVADSILTNGVYMQLAGHIQALLLSLGMHLSERHFNLVSSSNGMELPDHDWGKDYTTKQNAHSNAHQILVFSKEGRTFSPKGEVMYYTYKSTEDHPCPTPEEVLTFVCQKFFKEGGVALDPFMGTAGLGKRVLQSNGTFYGYEIDEHNYLLAKKELGV